MNQSEFEAKLELFVSDRTIRAKVQTPETQENGKEGEQEDTQEKETKEGKREQGQTRLSQIRQRIESSLEDLARLQRVGTFGFHHEVAGEIIFHVSDVAIEGAPAEPKQYFFGSGGDLAKSILFWNEEEDLTLELERIEDLTTRALWMQIASALQSWRPACTRLYNKDE